MVLDIRNSWVGWVRERAVQAVVGYGIGLVEKMGLIWRGGKMEVKGISGFQERWVAGRWWEDGYKTWYVAKRFWAS